MSTMKLIMLLLLFHHLVFPLSAANMIHFCQDTLGNYTAESAYKANLDKLLLDVATTTKIDYGFYNFSADQVNVIALCRADLTKSDCQSCLNSSIKQIKELCPSQKEAILWLDTCLVRYASRSIFGSMENAPGSYDCHSLNASDPSLFWKTAGDLLATLQVQASRGDSRRKFASGEANVTRSMKVYGLVQCTPDLSEIDCYDCLDSTISFLIRYCYGNQGGLDVEPSCNVMLRTNRFYGLFNATPPLLPPPAAILLTPSSSGHRNVNGFFKVISGVVLGLALVQFIIIVGLLIRRKRRDKRNVERNFEDAGDGSSIESLQIDFGIVRVATRNFSETNKLGRGGFGSVYKGILLDGHQIAVKRLAIKNTRQGEMEFKNEVMLVARLQHRNLVRLLGFSLEDEERLLIYEFVPNASLDYFLFGETGQNQLDWGKRSKIIRGVARGLLYLHEDSPLRIIHRDLKASNILLDAAMNPKIGDFGVARHFYVDQTHDTNRIVGTFGYMAPEYALRGFFSTKSDVYSFGVLVLEIVSGKKCLSFSSGEASEHIINMVWRDWTKGRPLDIVDPKILVAETEPDIIRSIHIGLLCVQDDAADRPTMSEVDIMLRSQYFTLPAPSKPTFAINRNMKVPLSSEASSSLSMDNRSQTKSKSVVSTQDPENLTEIYPR